MRLVHALAEIVCEQGLDAASAARVAARAGVTPREFEVCFGDLEQCLSWGCEEALLRAAASVRGASAARTAPPGLDALDGLVAFAEQQSELAGLCLARLRRMGTAGFVGLPGRTAERAAERARACRELGPGLAAVGAALDVLGALPGLADTQLARAAGLRDGAQAARLRSVLVRLGLLSELAGARHELTPAGSELQWIFVHEAARSPAPSR
jgi:AcrR family transcriptional regulator